MSPPRADVRDLWQAIARLIEVLGNSSEHVIVIGGVVPSMLAANAPATPTHWGTNDVDLLLVTDPSRDLGALEAGLKQARFVPAPGKSGWQWGGRLGDQELILEVVCDIDGRGTADPVSLTGCRDLRAGNFRGPRFAALDRTTISIALDGRTVHVPTTGLAGYLFAKAHALVDRLLDKDFYDFAYVVLYSASGDPTHVAASIHASPLAAEIDTTRSVWRTLGEQYRDANQPGPMHYAHFARITNPELSTPDQLRQDAVAGVSQFLDALL